MPLASTVLRRGPVVLGTALSLLVPAALTAPAASAHPPAGSATPASRADATPAAAATATATATVTAATATATATVTLVTGDRAQVSWHGGQPSVSVTPAVRSDGSRPAFVSYNRGQDAYAVPTDVLPYVRSGAVDERLFDVTYLARNGYGDTSSGAVPVIVQYGAQPAANAALPGARVRRQLGSIRAAALTVPKAQAPAFWAGIQDPAVSPAAAAAARTLRPGRGLAHVWLDRKLHVRLDQSVPLIGAPQAWAAGYDGRGVTVAILDTGVDATHPDLAGRIAGTANFTAEPDVTDHSGHGTHVASTIAGSGAASAGRYKGVAPGASLLIGKVCDGGGTCTDSSVLAGMQWAAASAARVVSMSLGGPAGGPSDPLSAAVDTLSAATGTLFVIAAGNEGPFDGSVGSPGTAAAALTVAATDKSDHLADFSSRGPLAGTRLMKPDIAAPGVNIVAARAAGTSLGQPVGTSYTTLSGTSMATPHVSGAAAVLAQQHPDWRAPELKAALMSSSKDDGYTVFEQGAGRVDLARAVGQQVYAATANLDFGVLPFPQTGPVTKTITYTNSGTTPVTLTLHPSLASTGGTAAPAGGLTADPTVTVPAGGSADAAVTLNAPALPADRYSGAVVATDPSGIQLRTPVGADRKAELFGVQVTVIGRQGLVCGTGGEYGTGLVTANANCKAVMQVVYQNVDDARYRGIDGFGPRNTFHVPAGHYLFAAYMLWDDPVTRQQQTAYLMLPEVSVTGATAITLDARTAQPVSTRTQQPSESYTASMGFWRVTTDPNLGMFLVTVSAYGFQSYWATPTQQVRRGRFLFFTQQDAGAPLVEMSVAGRDGPRLHPMYTDYRDPLPKLAGDQTLSLVDAGASLPATPGDTLRGKLVLLEHVVTRQVGCLPRQDQLRAAAAAGAAAVLLFEQTGCFAPLPTTTQGRNPLPVLTLRPSEALLLRQELTRHPVRIAVHGTPVSPYLYHLKFYQQGRISTVANHPTDRDLARVRTAYHTARRAHGTLTWPTWLAPESTTFLQSLDYHMPLIRDEYGGPIQAGQTFERDTFQWNEDESELWGEQYRTDPLVAGRTTRTDWYAPPGVPGAQRPPTEAGAVAACGGCRQGDLFSPLLPLTLPDPALRSRFTELTPTGDLHLYRGDAEIPVSPILDLITAYRLPAAAAGYRLTQDLDTSFPDRPEAATRIRTEWTFRSARPTADGLAAGQICVGTAFGVSAEPCGVQPLVYLRYALGADLHDQVDRRPHRIRVTAYHEAAPQPAAAIRSLALWASFDDGVTWQPAPVTGRGGTFTGTVPAPPRGSPATAVTLRATAADAAGNTVTQTVYRAYGLRTS